MTDNVLKHIVSVGNEKRVRLREYLLGKFPLLQTNSSVKKAIKRGLITVNGGPADTGYYVQVGDEIAMKRPQAVDPKRALEISVIYEDDHLAVVVKPSGIVCSGNKSNTIAKNLATTLKNSTQPDSLVIPLLVHRLDKATSGLLIAAKTQSARVELGKVLKNNEIQKTYVAIVEGYMSKDLQYVDLHIDSKSAMTHILSIQHLETKDATSMVCLHIATGRTHQIRKHMKAVGHPLVGDPVYNQEGLSFGRGLFLVASGVKMNHPITKLALDIHIDLPKKYKKYL